MSNLSTTLLFITMVLSIVQNSQLLVNRTINSLIHLTPSNKPNHFSQILSVCLHPLPSQNLFILSQLTKLTNPDKKKDNVLYKIVLQQYSYQDGQLTEYHGIYNNKKYEDVEIQLKGNPLILESQYNCDLNVINNNILLHQQIGSYLRQLLISASNSKLISSRTVENIYYKIQNFRNTFIESQYSPFKVNQLDYNLNPKLSISKDDLVYIDDKLGPLIVDHKQQTLLINIMASWIPNSNSFQYYRIQVYTGNRFDKDLLGGLNYQAYVRGGQLIERDVVQIDGLIYLVYIMKNSQKQQDGHNYELKINLFKVKGYDVLPIYMRDRVIANITTSDVSDSFSLRILNHENSHLIISYCQSNNSHNLSYIKHQDQSQLSILSYSQETPQPVSLQTDKQIRCNNTKDMKLVQYCDDQMVSLEGIEQSRFLRWGDQQNVTCYYMEMCVNRDLDSNKYSVDYLVVNVEKIEDEQKMKKKGWSIMSIVLGIVVVLMVISCIKVGFQKKGQQQQQGQVIDMASNQQKLIL